MPRLASGWVRVAPKALKKHPRFSAFTAVVSEVPALPAHLHAVVALAWIENDPPGMRSLQDTWMRGLTRAVQRIGASATHAGLLGELLHRDLLRRLQQLRNPDEAYWRLEIPEGKRAKAAVPRRQRVATLFVWLASGPPTTTLITRRERFVHALSDIFRVKLPDLSANARYSLVASVLRATHHTTRSAAGIKADDLKARRADPPRAGLPWPKTAALGRPKSSLASTIYDKRIARIVEDAIASADQLLAYDPVVPFAAP